VSTRSSSKIYLFCSARIKSARRLPRPCDLCAEEIVAAYTHNTSLHCSTWQATRFSKGRLGNLQSRLIDYFVSTFHLHRSRIGNSSKTLSGKRNCAKQLRCIDRMVNILECYQCIIKKDFFFASTLSMGGCQRCPLRKPNTYPLHTLPRPRCPV